MKINIVLPGLSILNVISGGAKVVYQYSNYLVKEKNDVCIYYDLLDGKNDKKIPKFFMKIIKKLYLKFNNKYPNWYRLDDRVKKRVCNINNKTIRNADITIATAYTTVSKVKELDKNKGKKVYFIQDFENWNGVSNEDIYKSYELNFYKITVSNWLKKIIDKYSTNKSILISNGIDENIFNIKKNIEKRKPYSIAYLYSEDPRKGCSYGIIILKKLIKKYSNLVINVFGYPERPKDFPDNFVYTKNANEEQVSKILNDSSIYMCTSMEEGFGLPGLEAMLCGCVLVSTTTQGVYEYANDNVALLSKAKDVDTMYNNICHLFDDNKFKINMAYKGYEYVQNKTLDKSCKKFEESLMNILKDEDEKKYE